MTPKIARGLILNSTDSRRCEDGAIVIWTSDAKRAQLKTSAGNELQPGHCRIDGGNWTVTGTQYAVEDAQKQLGGKKTCTS